MMRSELDRATFPSRRPRARDRHARGTLPDWVWGAGLGLIVLVFVGGYFALFSSGGGGGGSTCDTALPPLGRSDITAEAFQQEETDLASIQNMLSAGDAQGANVAFFGKPVHSFSHNVDPSVREKDETLAKSLCKAVLAFEDSLAFRDSPTQTALKVQEVRTLMRDAAAALGFPRPG